VESTHGGAEEANMARRKYEIESAGAGDEAVYVLIDGEPVKLDVPDDTEDEAHA
jgi:hypothetical protein